MEYVASVLVLGAVGYLVYYLAKRQKEKRAAGNTIVSGGRGGQKK